MGVCLPADLLQHSVGGVGGVELVQRRTLGGQHLTEYEAVTSLHLQEQIQL